MFIFVLREDENGKPASFNNEANLNSNTRFKILPLKESTAFPNANAVNKEKVEKLVSSKEYLALSFPRAFYCLDVSQAVFLQLFNKIYEEKDLTSIKLNSDEYALVGMAIELSETEKIFIINTEFEAKYYEEGYLVKFLPTLLPDNFPLTEIKQDNLGCVNSKKADLQSKWKEDSGKPSNQNQVYQFWSKDKTELKSGSSPKQDRARNSKDPAQEVQKGFNL